jgi:hypothetical protein
VEKEHLFRVSLGFEPIHLALNNLVAPRFLTAGEILDQDNSAGVRLLDPTV